MSFKLTLKSLLSETKKLLVQGPQKMDYYKEDVYRLVSESYSKLSQTERYEYVRELSHMHDYNKEKLFNIKSQDTTSDALRIRRMYNIKESLQPKYRDFFINLGRVPDGIKLLVDLRSDVIEIQRMTSSASSFYKDNSLERNQTNPLFLSSDNIDVSKAESKRETEEDTLSNILQNLASPENASNLFVLNAELKDLINVWFAGGLCHLERVTWDSSCQILQRISELEAVHPVKGWADLKRRVGAYRRCYVFTHPCMPKEPVVILHTALCPSIPASIREIVQKRFSKNTESILDEAEDPSKVCAAIFYSISSPHTGLNGINLGNTLIKRVVHILRAEFPSLDQFSTLSPIPGFRKWLDSEIESGLCQEINNRIVSSDTEPSSYTCRILSPNELRILSDYFHTPTLKDLLTRIEVQLETVTAGFSSSKSLVELGECDYQMLSWFLKSMAAKYLCNEKHRGYAFDQVCNFHLRNGAIIWRLNWLSDSSPRGLQNSYGVMVNYRYLIEKTETYSRQYMEKKIIELSSEVQDILDGTTLPEFMSEQTSAL